MPAVTLTPDDLAAFDASIPPVKAEEMCKSALAMAALVAPCITTEDFAFPDAAKTVLRDAVLRWNEAGTGAVSSTTTGPYGTTIDTRQVRRSLFWPSEIALLRDMCATGGTTSAFSIETAPVGAGGHADICSVFFGAGCSCGYVLTQAFPLYEQSDC